MSKKSVIFVIASVVLLSFVFLMYPNAEEKELSSSEQKPSDKYPTDWENSGDGLKGFAPSFYWIDVAAGKDTIPDSVRKRLESLPCNFSSLDIEEAAREEQDCEYGLNPYGGPSCKDGKWEYKGCSLYLEFH